MQKPLVLCVIVVWLLFVSPLIVKLSEVAFSAHICIVYFFVNLSA